MDDGLLEVELPPSDDDVKPVWTVPRPPPSPQAPGRPLPTISGTSLCWLRLRSPLLDGGAETDDATDDDALRPRSMVMMFVYFLS